MAVADLGDGDEVEDAVLTGELTRADVGGLTLVGCRLDGVRLTGSTFDGLELEDVDLVDCELSGDRAARSSGGCGSSAVGCRASQRPTSTASTSASSTTVSTTPGSAWRTLDRVAFVDCDLRRPTSTPPRCVGPRSWIDLTSAEFSQAVVTALRFERTLIDGLGGIGDLRDVVLSPDVVVDFAVPFLASFGITVDDGTD